MHPGLRTHTIARRARTVGGIVLAGFGAACLVITVVALVLGARPLVVRTGSMAPELPVGTVVLARPAPATSASVGDVVAVVRPDGKRILHRVARVSPATGGATTLVLRGDRNPRPDPPVVVTRIERPTLTLPHVGRIVTWIQGPWRQYWLGVLTGLLVMLVGLRVTRQRTGGVRNVRSA